MERMLSEDRKTDAPTNRRRRERRTRLPDTGGEAHSDADVRWKISDILIPHVEGHDCQHLRTYQSE